MEYKKFLEKFFEDKTTFLKKQSDEFASCVSETMDALLKETTSTRIKQVEEIREAKSYISALREQIKTLTSNVNQLRKDGRGLIEANKDLENLRDTMSANIGDIELIKKEMSLDREVIIKDGKQLSEKEKELNVKENVLNNKEKILKKYINGKS